MKQRIFIGSSSEGLRVSRAVQQELDGDFDVTVWNQDVFQLTLANLENLLEVLDSSDAGIFVLKPDDIVVSRGSERPGVRDNVLFELGMFIGRLGRERTFMLVPRGSAAHLPSDLAGLASAGYDAERVDREPRPAVASACNQIREQILRVRGRRVTEPVSESRLDRAMRRMSGDLERLLANLPTDRDPAGGHDQVSLRIGRADVEVTFGRIEDHRTDSAATVVALPANEYFDDACLRDTRSSLGAFVQAAFGEQIERFIDDVRKTLADRPVQRVARAERRVDDSYGVGQAIQINGYSPAVILVSATTERIGTGLRAEPHFLYAALQGIIETMNANRRTELVMPVLGAGHGGMPVSVALLFNLMALRSILNEDIGRHLRKVQLIVFGRDGHPDPEVDLHAIAERLPK
ncbi:O-acetyl-ADP-ribose deacetylase (regulator of RNase III) [Actinoplanes tereljensis]|uniref:CD-NTase-associated protein 12/Pycsar effector protein TIR domain-containing protein n=1 Tax=Paractinoplanes tereljensis TaxID=571912 RepID=A0A919NVJ0_9ACTN|nr:nucleotide-binding protein [Actinoplanes tereljensis]GIF25508.1 hypothetical protein Ate02nite_82380 [Actinoplanes tereljensis]